MRKTRGGGLMSFITGGGFIGNLIRGLGQKFGVGKTFDQPTYDMSQFNRLGLFGIQPGTLDEEDKISDTSFTANDPTAIVNNRDFNFNNSVGRFNTDQAINTNIGMGASRNMVDPEDMAEYFSNQRFMDGGIVDLMDIYD